MKTKTEGRLPARACYLIERGHHSRPGRWEVMGEFVAGSPWRDGRPVDDETMREEVKGYRRTWHAYLARVRCPNGEILSDNVGNAGDNASGGGRLPLLVRPVTLAPDWHPLNCVDEFILACGWKWETGGFVPPESWGEKIAGHYGYVRHWSRTMAAQFCIQYYQEGHAMTPWPNDRSPDMGEKKL